MAALNTNDPRARQVNPDISAPQAMPEHIEPAPQPSSNDVPSLPASMTMKPEKHHNPLIPIIIAITVAVLIIGTVVFVFIKSKDSSKGTGDAPTSTEEQKVETGRVSPADIETTKKEIDKNLNTTNDSSDFLSDDLTNQTLGL